MFTKEQRLKATKLVIFLCRHVHYSFNLFLLPSKIKGIPATFPHLTTPPPHPLPPQKEKKRERDQVDKQK